jgi:ribosomal-protein-alanine N-acetyltransferase
MAFSDKMIPKATTRLNFRYFKESDLPMVQKINKDTNATRFVGGVKNDQEIALSMQKYLNYHKEHPGYGYWYTTLRSSGSFVGFFLLKILVETNETEIGYRLLPDFWGMGLGTEGAKALVDHGFQQIGSDKVVAVTHPENLASQKVLEKAGLEFKKYDQYYQIRCTYYSLTREEWMLR